LSELLDVAIYTFACQAGLRAEHKVRGNPVLEGVSAFFGQLIITANNDTNKQFKDISPERLGGWQPGEPPSPQLLTLVSSRIKLMKSKQLIREEAKPVAPSLLVEREDHFDEEDERVRTTTLARCWRCQTKCRFCLLVRQDFPKFGHFRDELASPFLDVMERMLAEGDDDRDDDEDDDHYDDNVDDDDHDDGNDHADNDQHSNDSEEDYRNLMSDIIFPLEDEDEQDANGNDSQTENVNEDDSNSSGEESEELFTGSEED